MAHPRKQSPNQRLQNKFQFCGHALGRVRRPFPIFIMKHFIALILLFFLLTACTKEEQARPLVIVGEDKILPDDITGMLPEELWQHLSEDEKNEMLSRLIEKELLAQEAMKRGLADDPRVAAKIRAAERDILANIIEENMISTDITVEKKEITDFYRKNPVLFVRNSDEVHL